MVSQARPNSAKWLIARLIKSKNYVWRMPINNMTNIPLITVLILLLWSPPAWAPGPSNPVVNDPFAVASVVRNKSILRAIRKMGPGYDYKMNEPMTKLWVSTDHGKTWKKLRLHDNITNVVLSRSR